MVSISAADIIEHLGLVPLPVEGGYFAETYRSEPVHPSNELMVGGTAIRHLSTAIYYLLTPDTFSAIHRLPGPEIYHFYLGDPVELVTLHPDGRAQSTVIGSDLAAGMRPQVIVPGGCWQGSSLHVGGAFALMGTTMSPGYHHDDFELGDRAQLLAEFPATADAIRRLTR